MKKPSYITAPISVAQNHSWQFMITQKPVIFVEISLSEVVFALSGTLLNFKLVKSAMV